MEFTIIIDSAEQHPFSFSTIRNDSDKDYTRAAVSIDRRCLGRHPNSLGDYSLIGGVGRCAIERKSMNDAHSTILGFNDGHRARFESELENLSRIESAIVLVECSLDDLLVNAPEWGMKPAKVNAKILFRSVLAYQQDYKVPWLFTGSRELAEHSAYWFLHRWWEKNLKVSARVSAKGKAASGKALSIRELLELV